MIIREVSSKRSSFLPLKAKEVVCPNPSISSKFKPSVFNRSTVEEIPPQVRKNIKVRYKNPKTKTTIRTDYDCGLKIVPNKDRLETPEEEELRLLKVEIALKLSKKIRESFEGDRERITLDAFMKCLRVEAKEEGGFSASTTDDEIVALTAYYTVGEKKSDNKISTGLKRLPDGLLVPGDKNFLSRINILAKHYLVDIRGIRCPGDLEKLGNYKDEFAAAKLVKICQWFSQQDLFELLFPGFQEGENPLIPTWKYFSYRDKWQGEEGKELAKRTIRYILKEKGALKDNGDIDLNILKHKNWGEVLEEYGLKGMMESCPLTNNVFEAIKLAVPEAVGLEENQIKPWEITYKNMWQTEDSDRKLLIDYVTKYLIEKYLVQKYGIKLLKENRKLDAEKVKEMNWKKLYDEVTPSALRCSNVRFNEALKRVYPDLSNSKDCILNDLNHLKRIREPSLYDLLMLKRLYDLYSPNFTTSEGEALLPPNFSRKIENYRQYEEDGIPVSHFYTTKLPYEMLLYSLDMHYPLEEVFAKFVKENIESGKKRFEWKRELRDLSKLSPTEVFRLACLCNLQSGMVNENNQLNYNEVKSLKLVIQVMDIPWSNEGILELKKYLVNNPEAEKHITEAFKSVTRQAS